jgi:hypothetical protein
MVRGLCDLEGVLHTLLQRNRSNIGIKASDVWPYM